MSDAAHAHPNYVKIWVILLVLLTVSILGPMLEIPWLTVATAFGIAIIKTLMVAANFMHLKFEKHIIWFLLTIAFVFLGVFFFGVASDIVKTDGANVDGIIQWQDCIANQSCTIEQRVK